MSDNLRGPYKLTMSDEQFGNRQELLAMLSLEEEDLATTHIMNRKTVSAHIDESEWIELSHIAHLCGFRGVGPLGVALYRWFLGAYEPPRSIDVRRGIRKKQKPAPKQTKKKRR